MWHVEFAVQLGRGQGISIFQPQHLHRLDWEMKQGITTGKLIVSPAASMLAKLQAMCFLANEQFGSAC